MRERQRPLLTWLALLIDTVLIELLVLQEVLQPLKRHTGLHHVGNEHGQHGERETEDVEEREGHKGLLGIEDVLVRGHDVDGERR